MKIKTVKMIEVQDLDELVVKTYGRPYSFQQQDGCRNRGTHSITIPDEEVYDFENDAVPENVNDPKMGVSFAAWLARDPKQKLSNKNDQSDFCRDLWWYRNFYPDVQMIANDLHARGLIKAGEYIINIDW